MNLERRYIVFSGHNHYPEGGIDDFIGFGRYLEDCDNVLVKHWSEEEAPISGTWYNVYDTIEGERVDLGINNLDKWLKHKLKIEDPIETLIVDVDKFEKEFGDKNVQAWVNKVGLKYTGYRLVADSPHLKLYKCSNVPEKLPESIEYDI